VPEASDKTPSSSKSDAARRPRPIEVTLVHARAVDLVWTCASGALGILLLLSLGHLGQIVGLVLLVLGLLHAWRASKTFRYPAGTFRVGPDRLEIPTGLCAGDPLELGENDLQHAYLLRRAVPFTKASPLLVVEARGRAYAFPRDWFASDSDQRRVARALEAARGESA
jgi:hypothetical protein